MEQQAEEGYYMHRTFARQQITAGELDVLVIGGGITGAGIALDARSRGLKVGLVEKQDFGSGTSSRSTKLIHGGLRYLKQFEFALVREVGRERTILYQNAPHIVHPEKMLLPIVEGGTFGRFGVSFGLWLYDRLAGVKSSERRTMLKKDKTLATEPLLKADGLKGAGFYTEYRTDDARLTIEVLKTAAKRGALCLNYVEAVQFIYEQEKIVGAQVLDLETGGSFDIRAKVVINAAGPWSDKLRQKDGSLSGKRLHHTKGVHLVVHRDRFPLQHPIYFDMPDGRMIFAIPRDQATYIGTTDTHYQGPLEEPGVTEGDVKYILDGTNLMFPSIQLTRRDVVSSWSGIRPLIHEDGKSPSELSRKDEIFFSPTGLITIAGGKLTGFRKMAERAVDAAMKRLVENGAEKVFRPCVTDRIILTGGHLKGRTLAQYRSMLEHDYALPKEIIHRISGLLGDESPRVLYRVRDAVRQGKDVMEATFWALATFCIEFELCLHLTDFFVRRTGMLYFEPAAISAQVETVAGAFAQSLGWNDAQKNQEIDALNRYIYQNHSFEPAAS